MFTNSVKIQLSQTPSGYGMGHFIFENYLLPSIIFPFHFLVNFVLYFFISKNLAHGFL